MGRGYVLSGKLKFLAPLVAAAVFVLSLAGAVFAHPHIWIEARLAIVFDDQGAISAIRHQWTFDEAFSAWAIQGLDTNGDGQTSAEELQALADENMIGLQQYSYYTFAGEGADDVSFVSGPNPNMKFEGGQTTLSFSLVPEAPIKIQRVLEVELTDPEYYVALSFADADAVRLENAPDNCTLEVNAPKAIAPELEERLFALGPDITELPPELKSAAADLANVVIVQCGNGEAPTAVEATREVAKRSSPFAAPPAQRGLPVVRTGFLGWVNAQQQTFYGALTKALGQLKTDGNAFWVLGTLSFLYGVFHAAGPGHGKVIISSYMLATEAQLQRGIVLSFASAMMQSITAVVFVMIAAMALNMTSSRLSETSNLLVTGSYALVTALGLWLVVRKVFGLGHNHNHNHDHDEHAHHVVTPVQSSGGLREMIGVVLAVGLRPCSGALVVLVFALSQGVLAAGIVAVFLMGFGTAITVGVLASLAVGAKETARMIGKGVSAEIAADISWWLELAGGLLVFGFGVILLMANV